MAPPPFGERAIPLLKEKKELLCHQNTLNRLERRRTPLPPLSWVKTFRLGRIKAAVWENEGEQKFYSVTFARTYVDEANNYHDTDSFGREETLNCALPCA